MTVDQVSASLGALEAKTEELRKQTSALFGLIEQMRRESGTTTSAIVEMTSKVQGLTASVEALARDHAGTAATVRTHEMTRQRLIGFSIGGGLAGGGGLLGIVEAIKRMLP